MIPRDYVTAWRTRAPWVQDAQVEQDLVLSRALVEIFSHPVLAEGLAMRGGTAIYKLYLQPAARYSEDIDLVQIEAGPAGPLMDALREALSSESSQRSNSTCDARLVRPEYRHQVVGSAVRYGYRPPTLARLSVGRGAGSEDCPEAPRRAPPGRTLEPGRMSPFSWSWSLTGMKETAQAACRAETDSVWSS